MIFLYAEEEGNYLKFLNQKSKELEIQEQEEVKRERFNSSFQKDVKNDNGKFYFNIFEKKTGKGKKIKKIWQRTKFERKCK